MGAETERERSRDFVGRQPELLALQAALSDARSGQARLVCISGEAGVGKTRLAGELAADATRQGALVAWGRCWEGGGAPAYWPWIQVVRAITREVGGGVALFEGRERLARLVPGVRPGGWDPGAAAPD